MSKHTDLMQALEALGNAESRGAQIRAIASTNIAYRAFKESDVLVLEAVDGITSDATWLSARDIIKVNGQCYRLPEDET